MSAILGRLTAKFLLPALGLKELIDLIQGADADLKSGVTESESLTTLSELEVSQGLKRFAVVDLKTNSVIKFLSTRRMLTCTMPKRRRSAPGRKEFIIQGQPGCPPTTLK